MRAVSSMLIAGALGACGAAPSRQEPMAPATATNAATPADDDGDVDAAIEAAVGEFERATTDADLVRTAAAFARALELAGEDDERSPGLHYQLAWTHYRRGRWATSFAIFVELLDRPGAYLVEAIEQAAIAATETGWEGHEDVRTGLALPAVDAAVRSGASWAPLLARKIGDHLVGTAALAPARVAYVRALELTEDAAERALVIERLEAVDGMMGGRQGP